MLVKNLCLKFKTFLSSLTIIIIFSANILAQCPLITKIETKLKFGEDAKGNNGTIIKAPLVKAWRYGDKATIVLVPGVNVNVDGSPRAYSVGNKGLASILNGVKIFENNKFMDFQEFNDDAKFISLWLDAEKKSFALGTRKFDAFALYSKDKFSIVGNGKGRPKTQKVDGEAIEYYISMTSPSSQQGNYPASDQRRYFDSGEIPAFVVPRLKKRPKEIGLDDPLTLLLDERQLSWAYYPDKNQSTFAIGGDRGPRSKFGEATIAFHQLLRFGSVLPIPNYKADPQYTTCSTEVSPTNWTNCLYYPFYQRTKKVGNNRVKTDVLRVDNLKDTIFVFFDKNTKVEDATVTRTMIQSKGQSAMEQIGGIGKVGSCLKTKIPELTDLLRNLK